MIWQTHINSPISWKSLKYLLELMFIFVAIIETYNFKSIGLLQITMQNNYYKNHKSAIELSYFANKICMQGNFIKIEKDCLGTFSN